MVTADDSGRVSTRVRMYGRDKDLLIRYEQSSRWVIDTVILRDL